MTSDMDSLAKDYLMRVVFEIEILNALQRGEGTACQRRDAFQAVYGSKLVRMREMIILGNGMDAIKEIAKGMKP